MRITNSEHGFQQERSFPYKNKLLTGFSLIGYILIALTFRGFAGPQALGKTILG